MRFIRLDQGVKTALVLVAAIAGSAGHAYAGTCKTVNYFPGVVQVFGTAQGNGVSEDVALCTTTNACPANARSVEVYGGGVSSKPGTAVSASSAGTLASGEEVIASCEAEMKPGKQGGTAGICHNIETATADQGTITSADCALFVSAAVDGKAVANATCFCGE